MNLFVLAMLMLVLGNNALVMFIGWEGVGLCSYLLIGYYFHKQSASDAAKKAFVVNRVGDFGFLVGLFTLYWALGSQHGVWTLNFVEIAKHGHLLGTGSLVVTIVTLCFFLGATGKSAQIPLYTWLPDAMEGPTPVSALIHAATMVTAGVYMIGRMNGLFAMAPDTMMTIAIVGAATAIFAASIGLAQNDIKRVLAYSTVSQLGYMFLAMGVGAFTAGIFHLMTHAFFKACLFLGSGSVIHALSGEQDMRYMGGLRKHMPYTHATFLIATIAIAGIPGLAGFFSKDEILWWAFASTRGHWLLWLVAAGCRRHDRLLHVPPGLYDLLRQGAPDAPCQASPARVTIRHHPAADGAGSPLAFRRLCGRSCHPRRRQPYPPLPGAGFRPFD
jgi:NADH-quinone oxidoreductase subunit L